MPEQRLIDANWLQMVLEENFGYTGGAAVLKQLIDVAPTVNAVVLPCKVGDTVYRVITEPSGCDFDGEMERCGGCRYVDMPCDDVLRYDHFEWGCGFQPHVEAMPFFSCMVDMIGKTVFLTKEAAEAVLAERRDSHE